MAKKPCEFCGSEGVLKIPLESEHRMGLYIIISICLVIVSLAGTCSTYHMHENSKKAEVYKACIEKNIDPRNCLPDQKGPNETQNR